MTSLSWFAILMESETSPATKAKNIMSEAKPENLGVSGEIYRVSLDGSHLEDCFTDDGERRKPYNSTQWCEYQIALNCTVCNHEIDAWDSIAETYNGVQKLNRATCRDAISNIRAEV